MDNKIEKAGAMPPAYLKTENPAEMGIENIDPKDIIMPRLIIVQGQTEQKFGANDGEIINNIDGKNYGKSISFVAVIHSKANMMFDSSLKLECQSLDGKVSITQGGLSCLKCGKSQWTKDEKNKGVKPECNELFNYLIAEENELKEAVATASAIPPLLLSFMRTATKQGRLINTAIQMNATRQFPIYSQKFTLTVPDEPTKFDTGAAYITSIKEGNYVEEVEYEYLRNLFVAFSKVRVDMSSLEKDLKGDKDDMKNDPSTV